MSCRTAIHRTAGVTRIAPTPAEIIGTLTKLRAALAAAEETVAAALNAADLIAGEIRRLENLARQTGAPARPHPMVAGAMTLVGADEVGGAA